MTAEDAIENTANGAEIEVTIMVTDVNEASGGDRRSHCGYLHGGGVTTYFVGDSTD